MYFHKLKRGYLEFIHPPQADENNLKKSGILNQFNIEARLDFIIRKPIKMEYMTNIVNKLLLQSVG